MKIVTIVENESNGNMQGEKGLSFMVETADMIFLLDTGASQLVVTNLKKLGYDPSAIENVIISHNHNDHIGGLKYLFNVNKKAKVFISKNAMGKYVKCNNNGIEVLSDNLIINENPEKFTMVGERDALCENVYMCHVTAPNPLYKCGDKQLKELVNGNTIDDQFLHEIYVVVIEGEKINIISSCSHNGIINIINDAKQKFTNKKLNAFIGGLHITGKKNYLSDEEIENLADCLNESGLRILYTCHCTGRHAYDILKNHCNFSVNYLTTGSTCKI